MPDGTLAARRTAADIALTTEKESAETNERPAGEPATGDVEPRPRTEPELREGKTLEVSYAAQVPFAEPMPVEAADSVGMTTTDDESDLATDQAEFLSYAASATRRSSATTHDALPLATDNAPAQAVTPEAEVMSVESTIDESAVPAVEPVAVSDEATPAAEPVDEPIVQVSTPDRDTPPEPPADEPRSLEPARDWLLARMEQAAAAHVGPESQPEVRDLGAPSIAAGVQALRQQVIEQTPPPPPPRPPEAYQPPFSQPVHEAPPIPQPAYEPPPSPPPPREPRPIAPAYRAPDSAPEPIAAVASAADAVAPTEFYERAPTEVATPADVPPTLRGLAWRVGRYAAYGVGGYLALVLALIVIYRFVDPPASTLMLYEKAFGSGVQQNWVPLERISPNLVRAVIVAEDGRFCDHHGIDFAAIGEAIENADDFIPRGASTISMQVTKNLFLWQSKSYIRKLIELPLTLIIELVWPKSRVLEIYLNIAEWGPGVFGAEAAAQHHFNRPASTLSEREAAQLAAALPNPILRDAGDPGPRLQRKASVIQSRARSSGDVVFCVKRTS